jgi:hypothetical protein
MGFFDRKPKETESHTIQNAERIQDFVNRYKIRSRELYNKSTDELKKEKYSGTDVYLQGFNWLNDATAISDNRADRYNDYRKMVLTPELNQALSVYADNTVQYDVKKNVMQIEADNNKMKNILEKMFFDRLDMNAKLWNYVRNMCMLGDEFLEIILDNPKKPKHIIGLERVKKPENMERLEKKGLLIGFKYSFGDLNDPDRDEKDDIWFQPWQIVHMRIETDRYEPYGESIFDSSRQAFKKLSLMEDAMMVYRLSRATERYVFYIDVGNMPTKDANKYIDEMKRKFRKKPIINPSTGQIDEKANPMSFEDNFFLGVRSGGAGTGTGTRIESLPGAANLNDINDIKYFQDQVLKALGIPSSYLGGTGAAEGNGMTYESKSYLSNQDIMFARIIERIQKFVVKSLEKIAMVELVLNKIEKSEIKDFKIKMTPPSNVDQLLEMEIMNQQFMLIQTIRGIENFLPDDWIYENVLGFNEQDIQKIKLELQMQLQMQMQIQGQQGAGGGGMDMGGGGNIPGGGILNPGEAGGPAEGGMPEAPGAGAAAAADATSGQPPAAQTAAESIEFDGGKWLFENNNDVLKLVRYIKLYEKKQELKVKEEEFYRTSVTNMLIEGEFNGLAKVYETENDEIEVLKEETILFGKDKPKKIKS